MTDTRNTQIEDATQPKRIRSEVKPHQTSNTIYVEETPTVEQAKRRRELRQLSRSWMVKHIIKLEAENKQLKKDNEDAYLKGLDRSSDGVD